MPPNKTALRVIAAVPCPTCKAAIGNRCRADQATHPERNAAYLAARKASVDATSAALAKFRPAPFAARAPSQEAQFVADETDGPLRITEIWQEGQHVATLTLRNGALRIMCTADWRATARTEGPIGSANRTKLVTTENLLLELRRTAPRDSDQ